MPVRRARSTIRAIMIAVAAVAVLLAIALQVPREVLFGARLWLVLGPPLVFVVPRLLLLAWVRLESDEKEDRTSPRS
ncbi:MAG: hypothetical protein P4L84_09105 [Isosphaeraceae bacterium]|nr:hypothetical protein [Isosphaeraceae bacterium]